MYSFLGDHEGSYITCRPSLGMSRGENIAEGPLTAVLMITPKEGLGDLSRP